MSWHFSPEQEEASLPPTYWDSIPLPVLRWPSSPETGCNSDNKRDTSNPSPSGMTSAPSTQPLSRDELISQAEASPVKMSVQRVKVKDLPGIVAAYGSIISAALKPLNHLSSSRKTVRSCVPVDSAPSCKDLPAWGMTLDGACWELGTSAHHTNEIECGFWPTPKCEGWRSEGNQLAMIRLIDAGVTTVEEAEAMMGGMLFPPCRDRLPKFDRPDLKPLSKRWATPAARDGKDTPGMSKDRDGKKGGRLDQLPRQVFHAENTPPNGGVMNEDWREWLMGWPIGWTARKPLETDRFQEWQSLHSTS